MEAKTTTRSALFIAAAVGLWWLANTLATIASKSVMRGEDTSSDSTSGLTLAFKDLRWVELTALQHLVGAVLAGLWIKIRKKSLWPSHAREQRTLILVAALGNVVGNAATNAAYSLITSNTAQVIKACEPLFTFALTVLLYRKYEALDSSTLLSVVIIVAGAGAFLMEDASFDLWGVAAAMAANTAFPTRNIFLKKLSDIWDNPIQKFAVMSAFSVTFLLPVWLIKVIFVSGFSTSHVFDTTLSSFFHSTYNLASITVLESVSPVTHAILNISKRLFVISANIVYFQNPFTLSMLIGLVVLLVGCYFYHLKSGSSSKSVVMKLILLFVMFAYLFIPLPPGLGQQNEQYEISPDATIATEVAVTKNRIMTAWIYYEPIPREAVDNIQDLAERNPETSIWVFCGTSQCVNVVNKLNNKHIRAEFAVLPDIFNGTPLQSWLALHPIHKVLAGKAFETHLQEATVLSLLWKYGGFYVDPVIRMADAFELQDDIKPWVGVNSERIFDAAYFPRNDSFIQILAELFAKDYPTGEIKGAPFKFDFRSKVWKMVESSCPTCPDSKNLSSVGSVVSVETKSSRSLHFATLSYDSRIPHIGLANLGDEIQGFPGMQFLPFIDRFVQRDTITAFKSDGNVSMFFNAWWGSEKASWPPPSNIYPVMLSVHIAPPRMGVKWAKHIGWAKKHEPIGCRDSDTMKFLHDHGVQAFFTGCMTLFMRNPNVGVKRSNKIYLVDLKSDVLQLLPREIQTRAEKVYHNLKNPRQSDNTQRYTEAYKLIRKYGQASVVVTQRIHCALPCVAMGTPVIFINSAGLPGGGGSSKEASGRTSGLTPLFHTINLYDMSRAEAKTWLQNFAWDNPPPNPDVSMTMRLRATSWNVIRRNPVYYDAGKKFGVIPMSPPTNKIAGKIFAFHLAFTTSNTTVIETLSSGKKQYGAFNWRHWRSIESIFYHHPTSKVIVHSNTLPLDTFDVLREVGYSIQVQRYNLDDLLRNSPAKKFTQKLDSARKGPNWYIHEVNLLSFLLLHQQGGVYISTDTILVQPIDSLPTNSLGWASQKNDSLSDAFMMFEEKNEFPRLALSLFPDHYDDKNIGHAPSLLTTTWGQLSKQTDGDLVHALPYFYFNAVPYSDMLWQYFEDTQGEIFRATKKLINSKAHGVYLNSTVTGHLGFGDDIIKDGTISKDVLTRFCVLCSNLH